METFHLFFTLTLQQFVYNAMLCAMWELKVGSLQQNDEKKVNQISSVTHKVTFTMK